jgi:hypothetical protein
MSDAAGVPSAPDVAPDLTGPQGERLETGRWDAVRVGLAVALYGLAVVLGYLVLGTPQVRRLSWALVAACFGVAGLVVLLARSRGGRSLMVRWAVPLVAFMVGWACVAAVFTWSYSARLPGVFIVVFGLLALADVILVLLSLRALPRDRKVGVLGLLVIGLMWMPVFIGPPETTVRRLRMELAAPSLVKEAQSILHDPSKAKDNGPFIAYDGRGGRVVGWLRGQGFLGRGPGVVWDPEDVLEPHGSARTNDGYPWLLTGDWCEPIVDDWLYCDLR